VFTVDLIEVFINDLIGIEETQFPDNICQLAVRPGMEEFGEDSNINPEQASFLLQDGNNLSDEGLSLILANQKELIINHDIIESIFYVLSKYAVTKPKEHEEIPEIPEDATPEKIEALNGIIEEIKANNIQIDIENAKLEKMK